MRHALADLWIDRLTDGIWIMQGHTMCASIWFED